MKIRNAYLVFLLLSVGLGACISLPDLHEAKVLEDGEVMIGANSGYFVSPELIRTAALDAGLFARAGLGSYQELTFRSSWQLNLRFDYKYQLTQGLNKELFWAIGLNTEYSLVNRNQDLGPLRIHLPVYLSYHPVDWLAFYGNAKYILQSSRTIAGQIHILSFNSGMRFGSKNGMYLETIQIPVFTSRLLNNPVPFQNHAQFHIGFFHKF